MKTALDIFDHSISLESVDDRKILELIEAIRKGLNFSVFTKLADISPFTSLEWSNYLHLSERTMQRYKKEKKSFDSLQSERILQIALLNKLGVEVFGSQQKYNHWLETDNLALGRIKPKELLDNSFGISLLKDELTRIEYGVLA